MVSIEEFRFDMQGGYFIVRTTETSYCPICETQLDVRGNRKRAIRKNDDEKQTLIIRRLYCSKCKRIHHELPNCIVPYKRFASDVLEAVIKGAESVTQCSDSTARRIRGWWAIVGLYFLKVLETLRTRLYLSFSDTPAFKELVRAVVNSNNWIFAYQICTRSGSHLK